MMFVGLQFIHQAKMDMEDFNHNKKYKVILPILYIVNWVLMITGPAYYPVGYQVYTLTFISYIAVKTILNLSWCVVGFVNGLKSIKRYQLSKKGAIGQKSHNVDSSLLEGLSYHEHSTDSNTTKDTYHAFIIPSYKEDLSLLQETLTILSLHQSAKQRYLVYLAMEAHQEGSIEKADTLIAQFQANFKQMGRSLHTLRQYQQKGKASNVSWSVQNLQATYFKQLAINTRDIFITVIDADSWVPEMYIDEVDHHIEAHLDSKYAYIYQPSQIFTRNHMEVPFLSRTYDQSHSLVHFCNLVTCFNASFPLSNYTLSYSLIKEIGFWDTCADAIGEDFHTTIKAFWKTNGQVKTIFLHTSFNQVNIQTGDGYFADISARFWQAERHARGCADAAYCINMLVTKKVNWRTFIISFNSLQCFVLPAILPWVMLGSTLQNFIYTFEVPPSYLIGDWYSSTLFNICSYSFIGSYILYFILKRKMTTQVYGMQNQPIWRVIEFPLMIIPNLFLVSFPTFTIAAFKVMLNRNEYEVAKKKLKDNK